MARSKTGNVNARHAAVARIRSLWPEMPARDAAAVEREIDVLLGARVHRQTFCSIPPVRNVRSSLERALSLKCSGSRGWRALLPPRVTVLAALCVAEDGHLGSAIAQLLRAVGAEYLTVPRCRAASPAPEGGDVESPDEAPGIMTPGTTPRNSEDPPARQEPPAWTAPPSTDPTSIRHVRMNGATVHGYVNRAVPLPNLPTNAPPYKQLEIVAEHLADRVDASGDSAVAMHNILVDATDDGLRSLRADIARAVRVLREEYRAEMKRTLGAMRKEYMSEIKKAAQTMKEDYQDCQTREALRNGSLTLGELGNNDFDRIGRVSGFEEIPGYWEAMLAGTDGGVPGQGDATAATLNRAVVGSADITLTEPMAVGQSLEEPPAPSGSCGYPPAPSPP